MTPEQSKTLYQIQQCLSDLKDQNEKEHEEIKTTQNDIYDKLDGNKTEVYKALNNRPRWNVVMWLLGGVFAAIMIIGGMVYNVDMDVKAHVKAGEAAWIMDHPGEDPIDLSGGRE